MIGISGTPFFNMNTSEQAEVGWKPTDANVAARLWYRASKVTIATGNQVSILHNKVITENITTNQYQSDTALMPIYIPSDPAYNNKPIISFSGSEFFKSGEIATALQGPCTIVVVGQTGFTTALFSKGDETIDYNLLYIEGVGLLKYFQSLESVTGINDYSDTPSIFMLTSDGIDLNIYRNDFSSIESTTSGTFSATNTFAVGAGNAGVGNCIGKIAEVIYWSGILDTTNLAKLVIYLNNRYNLGASS